MIFEVSRTSDPYKEREPIENCLPIKLTSLRSGKEVECRGIEIDTLEELIDFQRKVDEDIILSKSMIDEKTPSLEIYDDYRE